MECNVTDPPPAKVRRVDDDLDSNGGGSDIENMEAITQFIHDQLDLPFHGFEQGACGDPRQGGLPGTQQGTSSGPTGATADARWGNRGNSS